MVLWRHLKINVLINLVLIPHFDFLLRFRSVTQEGGGFHFTCFGERNIL